VSSGNNTAPARSPATVLVQGESVPVLPTDNTAPAGASATVVADWRVNDLPGLGRRGGGSGENVHWNGGFNSALLYPGRRPRSKRMISKRDLKNNKWFPLQLATRRNNQEHHRGLVVQ
jgi:hypothetical protein